MEGKEFIGLEAAAVMLGYTVKTLHKKCSKKEIPYYKPAGKIFFEKNELKSWIASHRVATSAEVMTQATNF